MSTAPTRTKTIYCRCEPRAQAMAAISAGEHFAGEKYWTCMKPREASCGFFQWDRQPELLPVCDCGGGRLASFGLRKADRAGFFSCGVPFNSAAEVKRCRYFEFADPDTQPIGGARAETLVVARHAAGARVIGYDNGAPVSMDDYRDLQNLISTLKRKLAANTAHAQIERVRKQKNYNSSSLSMSQSLGMSQKQKQQQGIQSAAKSSSASSSKRSPMSVASTEAEDDDSAVDDFPADAKELLRHRAYGRVVRAVYGSVVAAIESSAIPISAADFDKRVLEDFASMLIEVYDEAEAKREEEQDEDEEIEDDDEDEDSGAEADIDEEEEEEEDDDDDDEDDEEEVETEEDLPPTPPPLSPPKKRKRSEK
jgi:hypothetical protein